MIRKKRITVPTPSRGQKYVVRGEHGSADHGLRAVLIGLCLTFSVLFAGNGATGYVVAGTVANNSTALGILFFVFGLFGLYDLLRVQRAS